MQEKILLLGELENLLQCGCNCALYTTIISQLLHTTAAIKMTGENIYNDKEIVLVK